MNSLWDSASEAHPEEQTNKGEESNSVLRNIWHKGLSFYIDYLFQHLFFHVGKCVSTFPIIVISSCLLLTALCSISIYFNIRFETNPQKLWVPDDDPTVYEKNYFDQSFAPFFRIEQMIVTNKNLTYSAAVSSPDAVISPDIDAVKKEILLELWEIQNEIQSIRVSNPSALKNDSRTYNISDLCYTPIPSLGCMVQSPLEYFQNDYNSIAQAADVSSVLFDCVQKNSLKEQCRSSIGIPMYYKTAFGVAVANDTTQQLAAKALLVTYMLNNGDTAPIAAEWEREYIKIVSTERKYLRMYYTAERSVEDELSREITSDAYTIVISYIAMFFYVAIALGQLHPVKSRFGVGFAGIVVVIMSVIISAGLCCFTNVKATLIISEVIPFLILAIGVDNMFIITTHVDATDSRLPVPIRIGQGVAKVGASMLLASLSEFLAFILGSLTRMPAVQAFCLYAGVAIIVNFCLQMTVFLAVLSIDLRRQKGNYLECEPFLAVQSEWLIKDWFSVHRVIRWFMDKVYAPIILFMPIRVAIIIVFFVLTGFSVFQARLLEQGLDQATALPSDSYTVKYFLMQREYVDLGPPVYFVTKSMNYTDPRTQASLIEMMDKIARTPYIDRGSIMFWLENYRKWLYTPGKEGCTTHPIRGDTIPPEYFVPWLKEFLSQDVCCHVGTEITPLCGFQFRDDVKIVGDEIVAARLFTQTNTLKTQSDFINSMKSAYHTSTLLPQQFQAYPYSLYYIFFTQYMYLPDVAVRNILIAAVAVLITVLVLLASPISSIYVLLCIFMIDACMLGFMGTFGILFNAVSVVNLVMSIGISVEFLVHITKAFLIAKGTHVERAHHALVEMGSNVLSGITITKLIGVIVLGFSKSEIFIIYYFKMYLGIVIFGALHGLVFLPALLAMFGPSTSNTADSHVEQYAKRAIEIEEAAKVN